MNGTCADRIQIGDLVETPDGWRWVVNAIVDGRAAYRFRPSDTPILLDGASNVDDWWVSVCNSVSVCAHGGAVEALVLGCPS